MPSCRPAGAGRSRLFVGVVLPAPPARRGTPARGIPEATPLIAPRVLAPMLLYRAGMGVCAFIYHRASYSAFLDSCKAHIASQYSSALRQAWRAVSSTPESGNSGFPLNPTGLAPAQYHSPMREVPNERYIRPACAPSMRRMKSSNGPPVWQHILPGHVLTHLYFGV